MFLFISESQIRVLPLGFHHTVLVSNPMACVIEIQCTWRHTNVYVLQAQKRYGNEWPTWLPNSHCWKLARTDKYRWSGNVLLSNPEIRLMIC